MLILIGITHEYQTGDPGPIDLEIFNAELKEFKSELNSCIKSRKIELVVEEFSNDALLLNDLPETTVQAIAGCTKVNHKFIDPNLQERQILGIRSRNETARNLGIRMHGNKEERYKNERLVNANHRDSDSIREKEWLRRLKPLLKKNVVFLFGFNHMAPFCELLSDKEIEYEIWKIFNVPA